VGASASPLPKAASVAPHAHTRRSVRARPARRRGRELAERKQRLEGFAAASGTLVTAGAADGRCLTQRSEAAASGESDVVRNEPLNEAMQPSETPLE